MRSFFALALLLQAAAFSTPPSPLRARPRAAAATGALRTAASLAPGSRTTTVRRGVDSDEKFGGYTAKQRLREEVESPFRRVRIYGFGFTGASAALGLYFSVIAAGKAYAGGFADAMPLDEALRNCAINLAGVVAFAGLTLRDVKAGQASLKRIAQGGAIASLQVSPAGAGSERATLGSYRRGARVVIAAGGAEYIDALARSLTHDERADTNDLAERLATIDVVVVPVLLESGGAAVGDSRARFYAEASRGAAAAVGTGEEAEKEKEAGDARRADGVLAFPVGNPAWAECLEPEIATARKQGFDVISAGVTISLKKNGRVLRRATGLPQWDNFIGAMEVLDGSKFGMPGDDAKYGSGRKP